MYIWHSLLRRGAQPRPGDHDKGLLDGGPRGGGRAEQVPRHVQCLHLRRAPPRWHCPRGGPDGDAAVRRGLHPGSDPLPHEQKRPGPDDGRALHRGAKPAGRAEHHHHQNGRMTKAPPFQTAGLLYPIISIKTGKVTKQPRMDRHAPVAAYSSSAP